MKIKELVSFNKEGFFNGAVQTDWFYDREKVEAVAKSYVFHGPKYYGVAKSDVAAGAHRLMDTASFAKTLAEKLYSPTPGNCFLMTVAGYGSGKSHLAVALGALFSRDSERVAKGIADNIKLADQAIGEYIAEVNTKKNFVIVLNGMNNFNLDAEVLRCTKLSLLQNGIDDTVLKKITKSYDIARKFVRNTFEKNTDEFENSAQKMGLNYKGERLETFLTAHVEDDPRALSVIDEVYFEINGDHISWERGLSAGDVLLTINEELCGTGKPFNKILLLFDEFGRYIEYTAANPTIAGEAALQQIFEAVQASDHNIVFVGFIQSELEAYLARIEKTSNITRYLERYRTASENLFLSSNFETILANVLQKNEPNFDRIVGGAHRRYDDYNHRIKSALTRWDRSAVKKSVWTDDNLFKQVILNGCYPLHPATVWVLANSQQWMQQRSTLAFAAEMYESVAEQTIDNNFLPCVYPYQIIDSGIYGEMLNSEEKGLVSSQYCMLYHDILVKVGDKLSDLEKIALKTVLVMNIGRMTFHDQNDAMWAFCLCSNMEQDEAEYVLKSLEEMHGVVAFDEHSKTYDLIAEANGFNEFKRIFVRYRMGVKASISDIDEDIDELISMNVPVETSFAQDHHISSTEWIFKKDLLDIGDITEGYLRSLVDNNPANYDGERARGILVYAYCSKDSDYEVERVRTVFENLGLSKYPVIIVFLDDSEGEILAGLSVKKALLKFSAADKERFKKHILDQQRNQNNKICRKFTKCVAQRLMITDKGIETYAGRLNSLCTKRFEDLFTKAVPFVFDGFENKSKTQAKATLVTLCAFLFNKSLTHSQVYNSLSAKDKNRVNSTLSTSAKYAWQVFDENLQLQQPGNSIVAEIVKEINAELEDGKRHSAYQILSKYMDAPYGMNVNSISLLLSYFMGYSDNAYYYFYADERLLDTHWNNNRGKRIIPDLGKIFIAKNQNADIDIVKEFCKTVLENRDVSQCIQLRDKLALIVKQEGESEDNKFNVAQAKTYLEEGIRLQKIAESRYEKANKHIQELTKHFSIPAAVKAFELLSNISNPVEEGTKYQYSIDYRARVSKMDELFKELIGTKFLPTLNTAGCKITELSQFKQTYSQIAVVLKQNGYVDLATATENRMEQVEQELLAKQKYESSFVDCERDISQAKTISHYRPCNETILKLQSWLEFFKRATDLPEKARNEEINRIEDGIKILTNKKHAMADKFSETMRAVEEAETSADLKQSDRKLQELLEMDFDSERVTLILQRCGDIASALEIISKLPRDIEALEDRLESVPNNTICRTAIYQSISGLKKDLENQQNAWLHRYIDEVENRYRAMESFECERWLERTREVPSFFTAVAIEHITQARRKVETRLHKSRVESALAAYKELTPEEQLEFKNMMDKSSILFEN